MITKFKKEKRKIKEKRKKRKQRNTQRKEGRKKIRRVNYERNEKRRQIGVERDNRYLVRCIYRERKAVTSRYKPQSIPPYFSHVWSNTSYI
jgi:hypothetical protein